MGKIVVIGAFGLINNQLDGQTVKTRNVCQLLRSYSSDEIMDVDTQGMRRNPLLIFRMIYRLIKCHTAIIIPARKSLTYLFPVVYIMSKIFRFNIILICVGGWQLEYFKGDSVTRPHVLQLKMCKKIRAFLPEMEKVNNDLKREFGFQNTEVFLNFRHINPLISNRNETETLKLVYLGRIQKRKGYETIFNFVDNLKNKPLNITVIFFGQIDKCDIEEFSSLVNRYSDYVKYEGELSPDQIQDRLSYYDVLLFPTTYYTEGLPGTIIDAFSAGLPVIATNWKHAEELICNEKDGFIVPFSDGQDEFNDRIVFLYNNRKILSDMKQCSRNKALLFSEEIAWQTLSKYLIHKP